MNKYKVIGMSCAACQARIEKAVNSVDGVENCAVSLLTNSMTVNGNVSATTVIDAVRKAGYDAFLIKDDNNGNSTQNNKEELKDTETPKMLRRLGISVILMLPLLYLSMGHMMWGFPLPDYFCNNPVGLGILEMLLSGFIMIINQKFFVSGFKALINRAPNMDTLVALGSSASFIYSVFNLFEMTHLIVLGEVVKATNLLEQFYFESSAMILTLITIGKMLEAKSKGKTTSAIKTLMDLSPKTATLLVDGNEKTVAVEQVKVGDIFVVKPGADIPVDGVVIEGESAINESVLTGESLPVDKKVGDTVSAATINTWGHMVCEASRVGENTTLSTIIKMVTDASATKAPVAKIADKVSGIFVPVVMIIALITWTVWIVLGKDIGYALARAVSVLVISCPCALGLATPVAIMVGNGVAAKYGILFKTATSLEQTGKINIVALDKTGTITTGDMSVTDIICANGTSRKELLSAAYSLELKSEHPISKSIVEYAASNNVSFEETYDFEILPGNGLRAKIMDSIITGGSADFIRAIVGDYDDYITSNIQKLAEHGKTPVLFSKSNKLLGVIGVADVIKEDSADAIAALKGLGINVVMITGDNEVTACSIAKEAGIDQVIAGVKPEGKNEAVIKLKESGLVAMVGDGINDAPALTSADIGIAIGAGTDIAIDAADVVLMKNSIRDVVASIILSRRTLANIYENLFWAFFYNCLGIPLAAGCYVSLFGWSLSPMFGAAAMGLSSIFVVTNALRLNTVNPYKNNTIKTNKEIRKEEIIMKINVKGMMCAHCEAHVKKALEAIEGIENAVASHEENLVTITCSKEVSEQVIKDAVVDAGYEYLGMAD